MYAVSVAPAIEGCARLKGQLLVYSIKDGCGQEVVNHISG